MSEDTRALGSTQGTLRSATSSDAIALMNYENNKKSKGVAYLLWFFFGWLGGHRFYLGQVGTAVTMLIITIISIPLAFVGVGLIGFLVIGIWAIVDLFLIPGIVTAKNNSLIYLLK